MSEMTGGTVIERLNGALEGRCRIEWERGEGGMATALDRAYLIGYIVA